MRFSIVTPTVQRESLVACCQSVTEQTFTDWQHIVVIDSPIVKNELVDTISHPQRLIIHCDHPHRNSGNTCRHNAWEIATGQWVHMLDDDNALASPRTLQQIAKQLDNIGDAQWTLWPIFRHGSIFFHDPPQPCYVDTGNIVARRDIARWPDIPDYASDAIWVEGLKKYPYKAFPDALPIMIMEKTSFGEGGGINGQ